MHGLSFLLYRQMSPQCTFNTGGLWQRQPRLLVLFCLELQDPLHSQPSDWLSLTEKHSILRFLIQKSLNRAQVYFMLPTPESIPVMAGNYWVSAPRGRKSRMRTSWDCPFNFRIGSLYGLIFHWQDVKFSLPITFFLPFTFFDAKKRIWLQKEFFTSHKALSFYLEDNYLIIVEPTHFNGEIPATFSKVNQSRVNLLLTNFL